MTAADLAAVACEAAAAITGRSAYFTKPLRRPRAQSARP